MALKITLWHAFLIFLFRKIGRFTLKRANVKKLLCILLLLFTGCSVASFDSGAIFGANATVSNVTESGSERNLELIMDDGRIFFIRNLRSGVKLTIGDRVNLSYEGRRVVNIVRTGSIYEENWYLFDD